MARVFISFAIEDQILRGFLVGQKKNARTAIDFTDYSVKQPWDSSWKTNCRARIRSCAGMIAIIMPNTPKADGQLWEIKCAIEERVPLMLMHGYSAPERKLTVLPSLISEFKVLPWSEENIVGFLNTLG